MNAQRLTNISKSGKKRHWKTGSNLKDILPIYDVTLQINRCDGEQLYPHNLSLWFGRQDRCPLCSKNDAGLKCPVNMCSGTGTNTSASKQSERWHQLKNCIWPKVHQRTCHRQKAEQEVPPTTWFWTNLRKPATTVTDCSLERLLSIRERPEDSERDCACTVTLPTGSTFLLTEQEETTRRPPEGQKWLSSFHIVGFKLQISDLNHWANLHD